jgi:putative SOS response-associated peptidase YedK
MLTVDVGTHPLMQRFQTPEGDKQMVVVLDEADQARWLSCPTDEMMALMRPFDAGLFVAEAAPLPPRVPA